MLSMNLLGAKYFLALFPSISFIISPSAPSPVLPFRKFLQGFNRFMKLRHNWDESRGEIRGKRAMGGAAWMAHHHHHHHHHHHRQMQALHPDVIRSIRLGSESKQGDPYSHASTSFDTNAGLIVAALLCLLICAVAINIIIRCILSCLAIPSSSHHPNTGLRRKALQALPTVVYGRASSSTSFSSECPICLAEFTQGDIVRVLPKCNHAFHVACIDTWLLSHSSCPTCRKSLLSTAPRRSSQKSEAQHSERGEQSTAAVADHSSCVGPSPNSILDID